LKNRLSPVESKNGKPLKHQAEFEEEWELRFGPDNRFHGTKMESEYKNRLQDIPIARKNGGDEYD